MPEEGPAPDVSPEPDRPDEPVAELAPPLLPLGTEPALPAVSLLLSPSLCVPAQPTAAKRTLAIAEMLKVFDGMGASTMARQEP